MRYKVLFENITNDKTSNMCFKIRGTDEKYSTLQELEKSLSGIIKKKSQEEIIIDWEWMYETGENQNTIIQNAGTVPVVRNKEIISCSLIFIKFHRTFFYKLHKQRFSKSASIAIPFSILSSAIKEKFIRIVFFPPPPVWKNDPATYATPASRATS